MQSHRQALARSTRRSALWGALGLGLALIYPPSTHARDGERFVQVTEKVELGVEPARAWGAIEDFLAWPSWHPAFSSTRLVKGDGHSAGSVRVIVTRDGAQFTEELVSHDAGKRSLQYRILESPAPVVGYRSTLAVQPSRGGSTVVWSSDFRIKPGASEDEVKKMIASIYRAGLDHLAGAFE